MLYDDTRMICERQNSDLSTEMTYKFSKVERYFERKYGWPMQNNQDISGFFSFDWLLVTQIASTDWERSSSRTIQLGRRIILYRQSA